MSIREMSIREWIYAILVIAGVTVPWYYNLQHIAAGGNFLLDVFIQPFASAITSSILVDLLISFAAFNVLLLKEGTRLGRGQLFLCLAVSWLIAFAAGFPLFLLLQERQQRLAKRST